MNKKQEEKKNIQKLGEILTYYKIITPQQLEEGLKNQKESGKRIGEILIENNLVTQDEINWVLGKKLEVPYVQININNIDINLSKNISESILRKFKIFPMIELNDELVIAMADPTDQEAIEMIKEVTKRELKIVLASFKNIDETLDKIFKKKDSDS
jgi:MSHA biogenesis protein MshE